MESHLRQKLLRLADRYETKAFLEKDPSRFMHGYSSPKEQEAAAFIAANLSFGKREQILSHVGAILHDAGSSPCEWLLSERYNTFFPDSDKSFYRMYTHRAMRTFCARLRGMLEESGSLGEFFKAEYERHKAEQDLSAGQKPSHLSLVIAHCFPCECNLIPHTDTSAAKRLNMFLRWMVRTDSPVDLGLWTWYSKGELLMPLDTHVMQEATSLGLLPPCASGKPRAASLKTAVELTAQMKEVFPEDPVRGDYALFGLGVDTSG